MIVASEQVTVMTGEETNVNITFSSDEERELEYVCTSSNPDVATVTQNYDRSITIAGISSGKASIKIECPGETKRLSASISVTVNQSPTRILAIGNSFSQDAVEQYLYDLAQAAGNCQKLPIVFVVFAAILFMIPAMAAIPVAAVINWKSMITNNCVK